MYRAATEGSKCVCIKLGDLKLLKEFLIQNSPMYIEGMMLVYWTKHSFTCITLAEKKGGGTNREI